MAESDENKWTTGTFALGIGDTGHTLLTVLWVALVICLLYLQGFPCKPKQVLEHIVKHRWWRRVIECPRIPPCSRLFAIVLICFSAGMAWNWATGFIREVLSPKDWLVPLKSLPFVFWTTAFLEESFFRGMLVCLPQARSTTVHVIGRPGYLEDNELVKAMDDSRVRRAVKLEMAANHLRASLLDVEACQPPFQMHTRLQGLFSQTHESELDRAEACCGPFRHSNEAYFKDFRDDARPPWYESLVNVVVFTVYHLGDFHEALVFQDCRFLVDVVLVGALCQEMLIRTQSLWPSVAIHCLATWGWLNFGGGMAELLSRVRQ